MDATRTDGINERLDFAVILAGRVPVHGIDAVLQRTLAEYLAYTFRRRHIAGRVASDVCGLLFRYRASDTLRDDG